MAGPYQEPSWEGNANNPPNPQSGPAGINPAETTDDGSEATIAIAGQVLANTASATLGGGAVQVPDGWLTMIQPFIFAGSLGQGSNVFVEVLLLKSPTVAATEAKAILWSGYLRVGSAPASIPNIRVKRGQAILVLVTVASIPATANVQVNVTVETDPHYLPAGGSSIWAEQPGNPNAVPSLRQLSQATATTTTLTQTVPAGVRWRLRAVRTSVTTAAAPAGARQLQLQGTDGASNLQWFQQGPSVPATSAADASFQRGGTQNTVGPETTSGAPELYSRPGDILLVNLVGGGGSDTMNAIWLIEEVAVP